MGEFDVFPFVERAAGFLVRHSPVTQQERWEEASGYSPSTLAAVICGLICAADIARDHGASELALFLEEHADWIEAHLEDWTVTNDGTLLPGVQAALHAHSPAPVRRSLCPGGLRPGNGPYQQPWARRASSSLKRATWSMPASWNWCATGCGAPTIRSMVDSLKVIDHVLKVETPVGPCWRRYNHDGYGQRHDGGPFLGWGQGRAWPLLTGERAHYELAAGHDVKPYIKALEGFSSQGGMLPEQIWDAPDIPELGLKLGKFTGAAMPLVWAHAEYVKLLRSVTDGKVFDRISAVARTLRRGQAATAGRGLPARSADAAASLRAESCGCWRTSIFAVVWTVDDWKTVRTNESATVGYAGHFADLETEPGKAGKVIFTLRWTENDRWEGRNFEVLLEPV